MNKSFSPKILYLVLSTILWIMYILLVIFASYLFGGLPAESSSEADGVVAIVGFFGVVLSVPLLVLALLFTFLYFKRRKKDAQNK